jgi:hypothetical protein
MFFAAIRILSRVYPGRVSWDLSRPCGTKILTTAHADSLRPTPARGAEPLSRLSPGRRSRSVPDLQGIGESAQEKGL